MANNHSSPNPLCPPRAYPRAPDLATPRRNHFFYGKLMDVNQFKLETKYENGKRWLLNRLVTGYGVVCGLNVEVNDNNQVKITRGVAIDKWGREIIVPHDTEWIDIPPDCLPREHTPAVPAPRRRERERAPDERDRFVRVWICYRECLVDPTPVLAGECCEPPACEPGVVQEGFCIDFECGEDAHGYECKCHHPEFVDASGRIDYHELVEFISRDCPAPRDFPCILLAKIRIVDGKCHRDHCNIHVRRIVFGNHLLFELLCSALERWRDREEREEEKEEEEAE